MIIITGMDVNDIYNDALWRFKQEATLADSRNGKVLRLPTPVMTVYRDPTQRVLLDPQRDANPFFHIVEAMWMLAGRMDVKTLALYNKRMVEFSDDKETLPASYGYRWRHYFGVDQLDWVIKLLTKDRSTRRAVLGMYDVENDTEHGKDVPCNTTIYFAVRGYNLDMTVCNRSNDAIWGAYGANVVHMSYLHEFVATAVGLSMGRYYQFSNDMHIYERHFPLVELAPTEPPSPYQRSWNLVPLLAPGDSYQMFLRKLEAWFEYGRSTDSRTGFLFLDNVLLPMERCHSLHRQGYTMEALSWAQYILADDWRTAAEQWLQRRLAK